MMMNHQLQAIRDRLAACDRYEDDDVYGGDKVADIAALLAECERLKLYEAAARELYTALKDYVDRDEWPDAHVKAELLALVDLFEKGTT